MEHWHFLVDFSDIYLESIHFNLYVFLSVSRSLVSPPSWAWEGYCCCSCLPGFLLGEEAASVGAWLLSVPGTPCLPSWGFCATQMPEMVHDRAETQPGIVREMSVGTNSPTSGAAVLKRCWVLHLLFPTEFLPASLAFSMENKIQFVSVKLGKDRPMSQISLDLKIKEVLVPLDSTCFPFSLAFLCFWTGCGG